MRPHDTKYKIQKWNKQKNCNTHFAINHAKKLVTKHEKSPKQNIYAFWNIFETIANNYLRKSAKFTHAHTETNLVRGVNDEKKPNAENSELFKIKKLTNQIFASPVTEKRA